MQALPALPRLLQRLVDRGLVFRYLSNDRTATWTAHPFVRERFAADIRIIRQATLDAAFLARPNRFKHKKPHLPPMPTAAWINPPPEAKGPTIDTVDHTLN